MSARSSEPTPDPHSDDVAGARRRTRSWMTALRLGGLRRPPPLWVLAGEVTTSLAAVTIWTLSAALGSALPSSPTAPPDTNAAARDSPRGFAEIRPHPQPCLTEGRDLRGECQNAVTAQLPCEGGQTTAHVPQARRPRRGEDVLLHRVAASAAQEGLSDPAS